MKTQYKGWWIKPQTFWIETSQEWFEIVSDCGAIMTGFESVEAAKRFIDTYENRNDFLTWLEKLLTTETKQ